MDVGHCVFAEQITEVYVTEGVERVTVTVPLVDRLTDCWISAVSPQARKENEETAGVDMSLSLSKVHPIAK